MSNARNCEYCNKEFLPEMKYSNGKQRFCSVRCRSNHNSYKERYGITHKELRLKLKEQDNKCEICGDGLSFDSTTKVNTARVDHDHSTGEVRGLLCQGCNVGIGYFRETTAHLESAIKYLQKYKKEEKE